MLQIMIMATKVRRYVIPNEERVNDCNHVLKLTGDDVIGTNGMVPDYNLPGGC